MEAVQQPNMSWKQKPRTAELRATLLNKLVEAITNLNAAHTEDSKVSERKIKDSALQFELATFMKSKSEDQFTKVMMMKISDTTQIALAMKQIMTSPHRPASSAQLQQDLQSKLNQLRQKQRQEQIKLESTQRDQPMTDPFLTRKSSAGVIDLTHSSEKIVLSVPGTPSNTNTAPSTPSTVEVVKTEDKCDVLVKSEPMDESSGMANRLPTINLTIASPIAPPVSSSNMHFSNKIFDLLNHEDRPVIKMEVEKPTQGPGLVVTENFERNITDDRVKSVFDLAKDSSAQAMSFLRVNSAVSDEYSVVIAHVSPTNKTEEAELVQICAMCVTTNKVFMAHVMPTGVIDKDVKVKHRLSKKNLAELNARPFNEVGAQFSSWLAAQGQNIVIVVPRPATFEARIAANYRRAGMPTPAFSTVALSLLLAVVAPALVSPSARSLTALCIQFGEAPPQPRNSTQIVDCCFRLLKRVVKGYTAYPSVANFVLSAKRLLANQPQGIKRRLSQDKIENPAVPHVAKRKFIGYALTNTQTHTTTVFNSKQDLQNSLQQSIQGAVSPVMLRQWLDKGTVPNQSHLLVTKLKLSDKDTA